MAVASHRSFQLTSPAAQVVASATEGVNDAAPACSEILSCLVAVASTMVSTVTFAAPAAVFAATLVTLNVTPAGTVTCACSLTLAVRVVVWLESGRVTVVCAEAKPAVMTTNATTPDVRTNAVLNLVSLGSSEPGCCAETITARGEPPAGPVTHDGRRLHRSPTCA